jgi:hypothetical protein
MLSMLIYCVVLYPVWYVLSGGYNMLFGRRSKVDPTTNRGLNTPQLLAHAPVHAIDGRPTKTYVVITTTPEISAEEEDIEDPWQMLPNNPNGKNNG